MPSHKSGTGLFLISCSWQTVKFPLHCKHVYTFVKFLVLPCNIKWFQSANDCVNIIWRFWNINAVKSNIPVLDFLCHASCQYCYLCITSVMKCTVFCEIALSPRWPTQTKNTIENTFMQYHENVCNIPKLYAIFRNKYVLYKFQLSFG